MKDKTRNTYDSQKANAAVAKRLREEFCKTPEGTKELAKVLGCSLQAVNQYKTGLAMPKVENLIKIAQHYGCSLNYLIGISDVKTPNISIEAICEYTGLSERAVNLLHNCNDPLAEDEEKRTIAFLNRALKGVSITGSTLFSWLEHYVTCDSVHACDRNGKNHKHEIFIQNGTSIPEIVSVPTLYREVLFNRIRNILDGFVNQEEEAKNNG